MAPHSSTLAWRIPWTEEPGRLQFMGSLRVGHNWATSLSRIGEGSGNPLQCSCLENPRDGGAWWTRVQSWTRLRQLSSSRETGYGYEVNASGILTSDRPGKCLHANSVFQEGERTNTGRWEPQLCNQYCSLLSLAGCLQKLSMKPLCLRTPWRRMASHLKADLRLPLFSVLVGIHLLELWPPHTAWLCVLPGSPWRHPSPLPGPI